MGLDLYFMKRKLTEVAYFRKYNFLIPAMEKILETKIENGQFYNVDEEVIKKLRDRCKLVMENHDYAKELLPTTEGFFFGNTDYDEYYFNDVEQVYNECNKMLENMSKSDESENQDFVFCVDW